SPAPGVGPGGQPPDLARHRAEIDQATGMASEQLDVAIGQAFVRLRAYAYAQDRRLSEVARDIVARRLRLNPDPEPDPPRIRDRCPVPPSPAAGFRSPAGVSRPRR